MGDFYECFNKDAEIISRVLNITLTSRDKNDDPTPMAGFPYHALDQHLYKLVEAGHNVAVAEQVEDADQAKGIVRREVTRVVTPGTLTDSETQSNKRNNYLASVYKHKNTYGIAYCDLSTGEFKITQTNNSQKMKEEINRIIPSEVLIPPKQDFSNLSNFSLQPIDDFQYNLKPAKKILTDELNVKSLASFGITNHKAGVISAGAIIHYLKETQKSELSHIQKLTPYDINQNMLLDEATIRNLNLVEGASIHSPDTSLINVIDHTTTSLGGRKLRQWLLHPLLDIRRIQVRLDATDDLFNNPDILEETIAKLKRISDLERILGRVGLNRTDAGDLRSLASSLKKSLEIEKTIDDLKNFTEIKTIISKQKARVQDLIKFIENSIKEDPPQTITEGGIIKEGYNNEIDEIRNKTQDSKDWIENLQELERERTGIPSLKVDNNKVFGYYIEITNTHKDKVPDNYVRKQTLVNSERYVTEELKEKEEVVFKADEKLAELEYKVFQEIREKVLKYTAEIQEVAEAIAQIDTLASFAEVSRLNNYCKPKIYDFNENDGIIRIDEGRHPIVEKSTEEEFISNDTELNSTENRLQILTGPNMSGKSTYIRQVATIVLLAQIGCFVPAAEAEVSLTDRIFTRVGASDDLSAGRSTFLVEMDEAANIINNATHHSLIVLDEIGRGTSTYDGVSIAWAITEYLHDKIGARCLFATHYHELLKLESELEGIKNYNVTVIEQEDDVIFLRKVEKGGTDKSYGILVAQMAGVPDEVIDRANEILFGFEQEDMFGVRSNQVPEKDRGKKKTKKIEKDSKDQLGFGEGDLSETPNIFKELEGIDPNKITPLQALQKIEKWKKRLDK